MSENTQVQALANAINSYLDSKLETIGGGLSYSLPVAGASTLGGVKIGAGLSMVGDTLNATAENYTLPVAGISTLGGVKIGAGLSMAGDTLNVVLANLSLGSLSSTVEGAFWLEDDES